MRDNVSIITYAKSQTFIHIIFLMSYPHINKVLQNKMIINNKRCMHIYSFIKIHEMINNYYNVEMESIFCNLNMYIFEYLNVSFK